MQQRQQLRGDPARVLARELHAAEQLRRPADQPREPRRAVALAAAQVKTVAQRAGGGPLQRRAEREPDHAGGSEERKRQGDAAGEERSVDAREQRSGEQRERQPAREERKAATSGEGHGAAPGCRSRSAISRRARSPSAAEPSAP